MSTTEGTVQYYFNQMTELISDRDSQDFDEIWDEFWMLSRKIGKIETIDWCDPDTSYFEDVMARYESIKNYLS